MQKLGGIVAIAAAMLFALACSDGSARASHESRAFIDETGQYPSDITPPPGTEYPCALTALPEGLPGIPESDRAYINRTYARILRATQAKLVFLKALEKRRGISDAAASYEASAEKLLSALERDVPPDGLESFHRDVVDAVKLQRRFFERAVPMRTGGSSMREVFEISEGRKASSRLISAWGAMQSRYPDWPAETKDSIYHHLCALDFF